MSYGECQVAPGAEKKKICHVNGATASLRHDTMEHSKHAEIIKINSITTNNNKILIVVV